MLPASLRGNLLGGLVLQQLPGSAWPWVGVLDPGAVFPWSTG